MSNDSFFARHLAAYPRLHQDRRNLLVHALAVPVFIGAFWTIPFALVTASWVLAATCLLVCVLSIGVQGRTHAREAERPKFSGPGEAVGRLLAEQLVTFPRFVLGGGFGRAWRRGPSEASSLGPREPTP
jgi:hypothetical protein